MRARHVTKWSRTRTPGLCRSTMLGGLAGLVALGGTLLPLSAADADPAASVPAMPFVAPVSLSHAGEVTVWSAAGTVDHGQAAVPASLSGVAVSQVEVSDGAVLALTATGTVVGWGESVGRLQHIPAAVTAAEVTDVATNGADGTYAAVVSSDGHVLTWGLKRAYETPLNVPAGLTEVTQVSLTQENAVALRSDGSVVAWGRSDGSSAGINAVPAGLKATAVTTGSHSAFALTEQGTVVAWGGPAAGGLDLPAVVTVPGNVKAVAGTVDGAMAILADDTVVAWGDGRLPEDTTSWAPVSVMDAPPASIDGGGSAALGMTDQGGAFHFWCVSCQGPAAQEFAMPESLDGQSVAQFSVGGNYTAAVVITKMLRAATPQVAGVAQVGSVLTATPGAFSGSPTAVDGQWLSGGVEIPGATTTTLALTAAMAGKQISYRSTATKVGQTTISSTSNMVGVAVLPVDSSTKVSKVTVAKKAAKVAISGQVTASKSPAGHAIVTIKKGGKVIVTQSVAVSSSGAVNLTVARFAKLVATKTKTKGKKALTAYKGGYVVTIAYVGTNAVKASQAVKAFRISR